MAVSGQPVGGISIREATPDDDEEVVRLLGPTLGWSDDERHRELFAWKHRWNCFGPSPGWIAEDDSGVVGYRALMRWEFTTGGEVVRAVRAVDTVTHPRAQGKGIFRALTLRGVADMAAEGVSWVFNTPNQASAPGYLKMGWVEVGRLPVAFRPSSIRVLPKLVAARQPSDLWSSPCSSGEEAASVLGDTAAVDELLLIAADSRSGIRTNRSSRFLRWRYGQSPVGYRVILAGSSVEDGVAIFRTRHRGPANEAVIADIIVPGSDARSTDRLRKRVQAASGSDYAIVIGTRPRGWLPLPGRGPLLTWRALDPSYSKPELGRWDLSYGDVELF